MAKASITQLQAPGTSFKAKITRVLRVVVYITLAILMIRGVVSIFNSGTTVIQNLEIPAVVSDSAQSYAQAFAKAYYTIDPENKEAYREMLLPFVGKGLVVDNAGMLADGVDQKFTAISTLSWRSTQKTDNTSDIDVRVEIEQPSADAGQPGTTFFRILRVPIAYNNGQYYVNDFPTVIPTELPTTGEVLAYPDLSETENGVRDQVKLALEDFFRSYSTDPASKLKYFMVDGKEILGYEGNLAFDQMRDIRVYFAGTSQTSADHVIAVTTSSWTDKQGFQQVQHHTFELQYKDERWYIQTFQGGIKQ